MAPRTSIERQLVAMWAAVFALDEDAIGIHDDFMVLGGDSLLAAAGPGRVDGLLQIELSPAAFFLAGTIPELAAVVVERHPRATEVLRGGDGTA